MTTINNLEILSLPVAENLNDSLYEAVTLNASGRVTKADATTEVVVGIIAENPNRALVAGDYISIAPINLMGIGAVKASAAITRGNLLVPSATDGKVAGAANVAGLATNQQAFGVALQAASAADEIIEFLALQIGP